MLAIDKISEAMKLTSDKLIKNFMSFYLSNNKAEGNFFLRTDSSGSFTNLTFRLKEANNVAPFISSKKYWAKKLV